MPSIADGFTSAGGRIGVNPQPIALLIARLVSANSSRAPIPVRK